MKTLQLEQLREKLDVEETLVNRKYDLNMLMDILYMIMEI